VLPGPGLCDELNKLKNDAHARKPVASVKLRIEKRGRSKGLRRGGEANEKE